MNAVKQFENRLTVMDLADKLLTLKHIAIRATIAEYPEYDNDMIGIELAARGFCVAVASIIICREAYE